MTTFVLLTILALVSSGALFVILKWAGVIGTEVVAEIEEQRSDPPKQS